jgi:hypothetical protein
MKSLLLLPLVAIALAACHTPEGDAWDKAHHVGEINWTGTPGRISTSPPDPAFNGKDYPDPHPHSDSDDAQRAAYIQHQQEQQRAQQSGGSGMPDLSKMNCTGTSTVAQGANAGMMTSSTNCHN